MRDIGRGNNSVKLAGSSVGVVSGVTAGVVGFAAIVATGGLATPVVALGGIAGMTGVGSAITSCGADIKKAWDMSELNQQVRKACENEQDDYITLIEVLHKFHQHVIKNKLEKLGCNPVALVTTGVKLTFEVSLNLVNTSTAAYTYLAEIASKAAAETVVECIQPGAEAAAVVLTATNGAKNAMNSTTIGMVLNGFTPSTTTAIANTAGENVTKAAFEILAESADTVTNTALATAAPAAREVGRDTVKEVAEIVFEATGKKGIKLGKALSNVVPFLNFAAAGWDAYESYKAYRDLTHGMKEEKDLKREIQKLKTEANRIVDNYYNPFVPQDKQIKRPYPND
jgi:hypothetical protein